MIAIKLWGGLGNQMFQYAFGKSLSNYLGEQLFFYISDKNLKLENIDLVQFNVNITQLSEKDLSKYTKSKGAGLQYRMERLIVKRFPTFNKFLYIEKSLNFCLIPNKKYILFDGYWQSYKYFQSNRETLLKEFTLKSNLINNQIIKII